MFAIERIKIIKDYLNKDKHVSVAKLSNLLNVTEVTIRRDLEKLESEGFLKRAHGGAVLSADMDETFVFEDSEDDHALQMMEISDTIFHLVSDNDIIMLTDGPTNLRAAKRLTHKKNLTVLTNDLKIALEFSSSPSNKLILLGGDLDESAVYGQLAINNMQNFSLNHLFVEVEGVSKKTGITVSSISKASLIQEACKMAETVSVVCLADHFGAKAFYRVGGLDIANKIITNSTLADSYKDYLFDLNIQLYTSVNIYEE
jgi:DeoR family transcriptional regulator, fructose operon transcriptional repressor